VPGERPSPMVPPSGRAEEALDDSAPKPIDLPAKRRGRRPKNLDLSETTVTAGVVAVFAAIGVATKHRHWNKSSTQVKPIAEPLTELLNTLPAEVLDRIERSSKWFALATGLALVAGPDIAIELEYRKMVKQGWQAPIPNSTSPVTPIAKDVGTTSVIAEPIHPEVPTVTPAASQNPLAVQAALDL